MLFNDPSGVIDVRFLQHNEANIGFVRIRYWQKGRATTRLLAEPKSLHQWDAPRGCPLAATLGQVHLIDRIVSADLRFRRRDVYLKSMPRRHRIDE